MEKDVSGDDFRAEEAVDALLARFGRWLDRHRSAHPTATLAGADHALEWKARRADGRLGWWTRGHVEDLLTVELPRRLAVPLDEAAAIPPSLAALFAFLADEGLLDPGGDDADALARRALSLTEPFLAAMADPATHGGTGKRILDAVGVEPVGDLTQADLDDLMTRFNDLSFEERGRILGLEGDGAPPWADQYPDPPPSMALPVRPDLPDDELDRVASEVVWVQRVDALVDVLGADGIKLTGAGWLPLADGRRVVAAADLPDEVEGVRSTRDLRSLFALVQIALEVGAAELRDGRLVARPGWGDRSASERWAAVVDAVLAVGPATLAFGSVVPSPLGLADVGDQASCAFLAMLWMADPPLPVSLLAEMIQDAAPEGEAGAAALLSPEVVAASARYRADDVVATLVDAGVVEVVDDGVVLCRGPERAIAPWLESISFVPAFPEDVADLDAAGLVEAVVAGTVDPGPDALAEWFAADPGRADQVVAVAVGRPEPVRLLVAQGLLNGGGEAGWAALRAALDSPLGPLAWLEMVDRGEVTPDALPEGTSAMAGVLTMLAVVDGSGPADLVEQVLALPAEDRGHMVEHLATATHPRTAELLEAIGRHLPDKAAAKHARKLAHRWRSRHGAGR